MMRTYLFSLLFSLASLSFGQVFFLDEESGEEYMIEEGMPQEVLDLFKAYMGFEELVFNPDYLMESAPFKVKNAEGKWRLFFDDYMVDDYEMKPVDSVGFPFYSEETDDLIAIVRDKGKYGFLNIDSKKSAKLLYDDFKQKEVETDFDIHTIFLARKKNKWGRVWITNEELEPFLYDTPGEVPVHLWENWMIDAVLELRREEKIDLIQPFPEDTDYVKVRSKKTKKWGLFNGGEGGFYELIPTKYDSISFDYHSQVAAIWKNGKVGYYMDNELVMEPTFDDLEVIHIDYDYAVALKKEGIWKLYDANEGTLLFEQVATDTGTLLELWLNK